MSPDPMPTVAATPQYAMQTIWKAKLREDNNPGRLERPAATNPTWKTKFTMMLLGANAIVLSLPAVAAGQGGDAGLGELVAAASAANKAGSTIPRGGLDLLSLMISGGVFMIPIGILSLFVVMFIVERAIGLRRGWIYPRRFRKSIKQFSKQIEADPRIVYQSCQEHPSVAANILKLVLVQVGRPMSEIKDMVQEYVQRGADKAYGNVRWLNFSAGVAPLLGLLGTVWGLIRAFHDTTQLTAAQLSAGQNRADFLAVGIYEALVTTLAGLIVAIPAAVASHYFEGKITRSFDQIEEDILELLPRFESYEGVTRFDVIGREIAPRTTSQRPTIAVNSPVPTTSTMTMNK